MGNKKPVTATAAPSGSTLPATITVAPAGVCTRHKPNQLWQARVAKGANIAANGPANPGKVLMAHPTGPTAKGVWQHVYGVCKVLGKASANGQFTVGQLHTALLAYPWQANGVSGKHAIASKAAPGTLQHNGYVGWVATLSGQVCSKRFSCAVAAAGQGNAS